ncbi:hypothetical protein ACEQ8H_001699 [Pleosporales sp. CAS-2024a]
MASRDNHIAPHTNVTEIDMGLDLLWRAGVTPDKVNLGLGWVKGANAGSCTDASGILDLQEIESIISDKGVTPWVSYDDDDTLQQKRKFANSTCLGGTMVWAMDQRDQTKDNGLAAAPPGEYRNLCCADGTKMGTCQWRGYRGMGLSCMGGCADGERKIVQSSPSRAIAERPRRGPRSKPSSREERFTMNFDGLDNPADDGIPDNVCAPTSNASDGNGRFKHPGYALLHTDAWVLGHAGKLQIAPMYADAPPNKRSWVEG